MKETGYCSIGALSRVLNSLGLPKYGKDSVMRQPTVYSVCAMEYGHCCAHPRVHAAAILPTQT